MKFDDLDILMRHYEECSDVKIPKEIYMVARLDGKGFSNLTKKQGFLKPFDPRFNSYMVKTTNYLIQECGFNIIYGYTQSDEISLLFSINENTFSRKMRKFNSTLAGLASSYFTKESSLLACFDCRISQLPNIELVKDYFSWRQADARRNALNAYVYWHLIGKEYSTRSATSFMDGFSNKSKLEYLLSEGVNFNSVPLWHKNGVGFYFKEYFKESINPIINETVLVKRNKLIIDDGLVDSDNYRQFINDILLKDLNKLK